MLWATQTCFKMEAGRDRTRPITAEMILAAKENLIARRETHLDQLVDKLKEERVKNVVAPMLRGGSFEQIDEDDIQYVIDLGLIRKTPSGLKIANPIYREIIPRELTSITQYNLEPRFDPQWYVRADGRLNMGRLLAAFQEFFREHSEHWVERFQYKEAGPQLLMQAFLQRIVNSGGRIEREYGLGRTRTDLLVIWSSGGGGAGPAAKGVQKIVIELKVLHRGLEKTLAEGLQQTAAYMDRCGAEEGHLVIFDRSVDRSWEEKIFCREEVVGGRKVTVWGM